MKISTDSIQGFAEMSDADKVTALLGLDVPDQVDLSGYVKKEVFDAKATEAANLSKQLKSKMTDDEAAKAQADADRKALEDKYTELLRKSTIAEHTARYIAMPGYDEKLARELADRTATALTDRTGQGTLDVAITVLISIVLGALILAGLYLIVDDTVLPTITQRIKDMFDYGG